MATYLLTGKAKQDLADIADYTKEHWGRSQARIYLNEIEAGCEKIAGKPSIGKSREEISKDLMSFPVESHVVYYQHKNQQVIVVRVLHRRMLPNNHI